MQQGAAENNQMKNENEIPRAPGNLYIYFEIDIINSSASYIVCMDKSI